MSRPDVVAIVQAGGKGSRMDVLTDGRAKPALPFGGNHQLIDFPLSNLHHSGIDEVWLCVQYEPHSLLEEVAGGRPWELDRTGGGLRFVLPEQTGGDDTDDGLATGNADLLYRIRRRIAERSPEAVVVMSADHVYTFDYQDALTTHRAAQAECTVVTTTCAREEAAAHATVLVGRNGVVTGFSYKPDRPETSVIAAEIFVYDPDVLIGGLEDLAATTGERTDNPDDTGLGDFGEHLLPWFVARGRTVAHEMSGYWIDAGRPETYLRAHRDLIEGRLDLHDPARPLLTRQPQRPAARIRDRRPGGRQSHRRRSGRGRDGATQRHRPRGAGRGRRRGDRLDHLRRHRDSSRGVGPVVDHRRARPRGREGLGRRTTETSTGDQ